MALNDPIHLAGNNKFVDVYAATGITVGTSIIIQNVGAQDVQLYEGATEPRPDKKEGFNVVKPGIFIVADSALAGVWAMSINSSQIQVEVNI